jgi:F-type H+-transporting ATPase subunit k
LNSDNSSVIFGRAIKNEYLALSVLTTTFGGAWLATRGGKKAEAKPVAGQSVQQVKESIPINASSRRVFLALFIIHKF